MFSFNQPKWKNPIVCTLAVYVFLPSIQLQEGLLGKVFFIDLNGGEDGDGAGEGHYFWQSKKITMDVLDLKLRCNKDVSWVMLVEHKVIIHSAHIQYSATVHKFFNTNHKISKVAKDFSIYQLWLQNSFAKVSGLEIYSTILLFEI